MAACRTRQVAYRESPGHARIAPHVRSSGIIFGGCPCNGLAQLRRRRSCARRCSRHGSRMERAVGHQPPARSGAISAFWLTTMSRTDHRVSMRADPSMSRPALTSSAARDPELGSHEINQGVRPRSAGRVPRRCAFTQRSGSISAPGVARAPFGALRTPAVIGSAVAGGMIVAIVVGGGARRTRFTARAPTAAAS